MVEEAIVQESEQFDQPNPYEFPEYFFAGFWIRFFAFLVDLLCIVAISTIVINFLSMISPISSSNSLLSVNGLVKLIVYLGYFILLTKLNRGQTIGKMIFGLQVISMDDIQLSWTTVLIREGACRFILKTSFLVLGYIVAAFTNRKQHPGDYLSQTAVVSLTVVKAHQMGQRVN